MQLVTLKAVLATVWISVMLILGLTRHLDSLSSWILVAGAALLPPIVMMWRGNPSGQPISESIYDARR